MMNITSSSEEIKGVEILLEAFKGMFSKEHLSRAAAIIVPLQ